MKKLCLILSCLLLLECALRGQETSRPNILWITSEDNGPHLGCYGDAYSTTPNLDALAARGMIYLNAWSTAPVCAPARTAIISGMYPSSLGAEHMRSLVRMPANMKMYPQYLRGAGYYCTNNSKEDYNLEKPGSVWDESSPKAHWKNRQPGQPFFAIFNHTVSHESQIRRRPHTPVHDPAKVRVRAYHPDTPEVRLDWAQYYDKITEMDALAGKNLKELAEAGLAEDTIIFYYGDHGSGMPRNKRWTYDSGLHVPLIVHVPEKFRHLAAKDYAPGGKTDRLVGFVDLAPTVLSVAGIQPPEHMQGRAFMGKFEAPPQPYLFGQRARMDERYDLVRSVRDQRYIYIRNYMPHRIYGQHVSYMFQTPTTRVWKRLYDEGKLAAPQTFFWEPKPPEELYDLQNDPDEVNNLAASPRHQEIAGRFRTALQEHTLRIRDLGFLPEAEMHTRGRGTTLYEMGHDEAKYPLPRILTAAEAASSMKPDATPQLKQGMKNEDNAVRYWSAMGLLMRGQPAVQAAADLLVEALSDSSPNVQIAAAEALARHGSVSDQNHALEVLLARSHLEHNNVFTSIHALNALDELDEKAASLKEAIRKLPEEPAAASARSGGYVPRLLEKIQQDLE